MRLRFLLLLILLSNTLSSAQTAKFDMLDWMTMDPFGSHMSGTGTPMWTVMDSAHGKFYWVKSPKGYPWDVKSFDSNFIYDTITEVSWSDPQTFKRHIGPNGKGYPITPRFVPYVPGAAPTKLWTITIPPSSTNFEIHSSCSQYRMSNLGYAKTEIWGPFYESLGGDLPPNTETLHLNWLWSCDSSYNNCKVKERFTLMRAYGSVKWENYKLSSGQYVLQQASLRNVASLGITSAVHPCWN